MELQIPHSICAKVQKESVFCRKAGSNQGDNKDIVPVEGCRNNRRGSMPRSYPSTSKYPTEDERIRIYGIFKRKKQLNDIPEVWEYEICISEQRILVQRVLCRYGGKEHQSY